MFFKDFGPGLLFLLLSLGVYIFRPKQFRSGLSQRYFFQYWVIWYGLIILMIANDIIRGIESESNLGIIMLVLLIGRITWGLLSVSRIKKTPLNGVSIGSYDVGGIMAALAFSAIPIGLLMAIFLVNENRNWGEGLLLILCVIYLIYFQKLAESKIVLSDTGITSGETYIRWSSVSEYSFIEHENDMNRLIVRLNQRIPWWDIRWIDLPLSKRQEVEKCLAENIPRTRTIG